MLKEFVDRLLSLSAVQRHQIHGLEYADRGLVVVEPPMTEALKTVTLTGLVDLIRAKIQGLEVEQWVLQVVDHRTVQLLARSTEPYGRRAALIRTQLVDGEGFPFGKFLHREEFVIGLQAHFVPQGDVVAVLRTSSALEASTVALAEDDGISQRTTVRQGVQLKHDVTVKGRVTLRPYRTFREVPQPESEFIFRLRSQAGAIPECALFEADGGKWKLDAVLAIKAWLEQQQLGLPVVA